MIRAAVAFSLALSIAADASAVLIDGIDGSAGVAPFPLLALEHVGARGGLSAIYLGNGVVLTAHHVGAGDVDFGGTVCRAVPGTAVQLANADGTFADLLVFEVYPRPDLPDLAIVSQRPAYLSWLLVAGNGLDRGPAIWWDPNGTSPPGLTPGFRWLSAGHLRWGFNNVEVLTQSRVFNTQVFGSDFDAGRVLPEAQAVVGDSGGAAFSLTPQNEWELSGVILGIVQYSGQPASTTFFGQRTYYADVAYYRSQLEDAVALPEPVGALAAGFALVAALASRSRSSASAGAPLRRAACSRCRSGSPRASRRGLCSAARSRRACGRRSSSSRAASTARRPRSAR